MPEAKQYLRLKRVTGRDIFLRSRVDLADDQRFRRGDVVAACSACRGVSKRENWLAAGSCPFCGGNASMPFSGMRDLERRSEPRVYYSMRKIDGRGRLFIGLQVGLLAIIALALIIRAISVGNAPRAGFYRSDDGHYYFVTAGGTRYNEGTYSIGGSVYTFADGWLKGPATIEYDGREQLVGENGLSYVGWYVKNGVLQYCDETGVLSARLPETDGAGFYTLDGLGRVFIDGRRMPGQGWVAYNGALYHFNEGKASPIQNMDGDFDTDGRYTPREAGLVDLGESYGSYMLDADGTLVTGLAPYNGFVFAVDQSGKLQRNGSAGTDIPVAASGILQPSADARLDTAGGSVILAGGTGAIKTGWTLFDGAAYFAGADGYLRCGERCDAPEGLFDAAGRFVPDAPGRMELGGLRCYIDSTGALVTGAVLDGDRLYLFDADGALMADQLLGDTGSTDAQGRFTPFSGGMHLVMGKYYCFTQQGGVLTGWQNLGKLYYFDETTGSRLEAGSRSSSGEVYPLSAEGYFQPAKEGLYTLGGAEYYVLTDGTPVTGWRAVDGELTLFDENTGARQDTDETPQTGWTQRLGGRFYVLENGEVARGWQVIDGLTYYFDAQSGAAVTGSRAIAGTTYRFRADGVLQPEAPLAVAVDGQLRRIGTDGAPHGGFLYEDGRLYFYDMATATLAAQLPSSYNAYTSALGGYIVQAVDGLLRTDEGAYYLTSDGQVYTGWFIADGALYYADSHTGLLAPDGETADGLGDFKDGVFTLRQDGEYEADGKLFTFTGGRLANGWLVLGDHSGVSYARGGELSYANTDVTIDGVSYHFDASRRYIPGQNTVVNTADGCVLVLADGKLPDKSGSYLMPDMRICVVDENGKTVTKLSDVNGDDAFGAVEDGIVRPNAAGMLQLGETAYLMDADGCAQTGYKVFQDKLYLFDATTARMIKNAQGFGPDGWYLPSSVGIQQLPNRSLYMFRDLNGTVATGMVKSLDGSVRFFGEDGRMRSGLVDYAGARYYFDKSSSIMAQSVILFGIWDVDNKYDFYAQADGRLAVGWTRVDNTLRYFDEKGHMLYDTIVDGIYINLYGEATN